jgi:hypothetical protein
MAAIRPATCIITISLFGYAGEFRVRLKQRTLQNNCAKGAVHELDFVRKAGFNSEFGVFDACGDDYLGADEFSIFWNG